MVQWTQMLPHLRPAADPKVRYTRCASAVARKLWRDRRPAEPESEGDVLVRKPRASLLLPPSLRFGAATALPWAIIFRPFRTLSSAFTSFRRDPPSPRLPPSLRYGATSRRGKQDGATSDATYHRGLFKRSKNLEGLVLRKLLRLV